MASKYCHDLNEFLSQCELNYYILTQLWPFLTDTKERLLTVNACSDFRTANLDSKLNIGAAQSEVIDLQFVVTDVARYTTTMLLTINSPQLKSLTGFQLIIRLYHDAKMLEVMEGSGPSTLQPVSQKKEVHLKPVDEKRQINRFVGECLRAVLV